MRPSLLKRGKNRSTPARRYELATQASNLRHYLIPRIVGKRTTTVEDRTEEWEAAPAPRTPPAALRVPA